jgi:cellulase
MPQILLTILGGAQFYMEVSPLSPSQHTHIILTHSQCAQIRVTGSGTNKGSNFVSFPGAYTANDPGIQVSIYDTKGQPYPASYKIPGPSPLTCSGGSGGGDSGSSPQPAPEQPSGEAASLYGQCGGATWTGPTTCAQGTCKASNEHYSQCVP